MDEELPELSACPICGHIEEAAEEMHKKLESAESMICDAVPFT